MAAEAAKLIAPLNTLLDKEEGKKPQLHSREEEWKELCKTRWGVTSLSKEYNPETVPLPWKHLYLQNNLQGILLLQSFYFLRSPSSFSFPFSIDFVNSLNDRPDFPALYEALELSAPTLRELEITVFDTKKLKSGFHFLTGWNLLKFFCE